jgi:mannose-1-phosphate guanylyltransferase
MKIIVLADQSGLKEIQPSLTLLESCIGMFREEISEQDIHVQIPQILEKQITKIAGNCRIITEPAAKGTAPALGLAILKIFIQNPEEIVTVAYSDHPVSYRHKLLSTLNITKRIIESSQKPILIGVNPTFPATNYGYVKIGKAIQDTNGKILFEMVGFKEKPDKKTAEEFLSSWQYLWNTGYMTAKASQLMEIYKKYLPEIYGGLMMIKEAIGSDIEEKITKTVFKTFPKISIDKGIFEKIDTHELNIMSVDLNISNFNND